MFVVLDPTPYDYNELLHKSLLFYEAQRSGALPPRYNRIPWRGDSTLKDGCSLGVDLSAGWFDGKISKIKWLKLDDIRVFIHVIICLVNINKFVNKRDGENLAEHFYC